MKRLALVVLVAAVLLLAGCASFQDAYYTDHEFGKASQQTWTNEVVYPEGRNVKKTPAGLEGITAEQIMNVHTQTFAVPPQKSNVMNMGITGY
ncbi:MAG TPA: hypothetical protein VJ955_01095 [Desulfuromonadales bacterium]|nr:hypothetical protein [Desulfuromonadales bacterium]